MHPVGFTLLCLVVAPLVASDPETPASPPRALSSRLAGEIRAALPKYQPPVTAPAPTAGSPLQHSDVLELPRMTVTQKRVQAMEPDTLLSKGELGRKMTREYLVSLAEVSDLNLFLNSLYIPLFSAPVKTRAREAYRQKKMSAEFSRLAGLAELVKELDPAEADRLKRDLDLSRLPGK